MRSGTWVEVSLSVTKSALEQRRELEADLVYVCGGGAEDEGVGGEL